MWRHRITLAPARRYSSAVLKSDINITRNGEVKFATGIGGRSSKSGYTATVFGSTGFLGRYLVTRLAKHGTITMAPNRDEMKKRLLKVGGDLGVVNFVDFDLRNVQSINDAVKNSDIVFNLVGADANTKNFSMADVNIEGARRIAQAAKDHGVPRLVHVSSYNANPDSSSVFYATKGLGEQVVKDIYPDATIVRPSLIYGAEDKFLNELGDNLRFLTVNHMQETVTPVHVIDVVSALEKIGFDDSTVGQLYELAGPETFSIREIRDLIQPVTSIKYTSLNVPKGLALKWTEFLQKFWWPMMSPDQIERQFIDQCLDPNAKTFADLGILPGKLQSHLFEYTRKFRNQLHAQDLPPSFEDFKRNVSL